MIAYFTRRISLKNLQNKKPRAQIATLLILMMVAILVFILATVNLGKVSVTATNLSNASDSASAYLASQLATKAYRLSQALRDACGDPLECCEDTGILATVLAVAAAIIVTVLIPGIGAAIGSGILSGISAAAGAVGLGTISASTIAAGSLVVGGMAAGTVGGAAGGAIAGTGALQGALQGAAIGAAIGYGAGAGVSGSGETIKAGTTGLTAGSNGVTITTTTASEGVYFSPGQIIPPLTEQGTISFGTVSSIGALGHSALVSLAASASTYNAYISDKMTAAAFSSAAKSLNGLLEEDQIRESVFLQALSQTVDDPNETPDINDSDGDGDTQKKVPKFQVWWDERITILKEIVPELQARTKVFLNDDYGLNKFNAFAKKHSSAQGLFHRKEEGGVDSKLVKLLRGLEDAGIDLSFWKPGKSPEGPECPTCAAGPEYDELYAIEARFKMMSVMLQGVKGADKKIAGGLLNQKVKDLTSTWQSWIALFYQPDGNQDSADASTTLNTIIYGDGVFKGLDNWKKEIELQRQLLDQCIYGTGQACADCATCKGNCVINPPCKNADFGTIDMDMNDEFKDAKDEIDNVIKEINKFRAAFKNYNDDMQEIYDTVGATMVNYGGINPVIYEWNDSLGRHSVSVKTGPIPIPYTDTDEHGNLLSGEVCLVLKNYQGTARVSITRKDPANKEVGILGKWNPFSAGKDSVEITRKSGTVYSFNRVHLPRRE